MSGKILILGGGFGGVRAALDLEKKLGEKAEITLIDRNPYHLFIPALYETASAVVELKDQFAVPLKKTVAIPFGDIFTDKRVNVVQSEIQNIDLVSQVVRTATGASYYFDYLILGLGSEVADYGLPGVKEYAYQFRTADDAILINKKILEFYDGNICQTKPLRIGIGGAGFSGIELAAELALTARRTARTCGKPIKDKPVVFLFEAQPQILPQASRMERYIICRRLAKLGVGILENARISSVQSEKVTLKTGQDVPVDMMIWTAGIQSNHILRGVDGLILTEKGKVVVDEYLRALNHQNIFAVGDNIELIDHKTQKSLPALAYLAIDHGQIAAQNIVRTIEGRSLRKHKPFHETWIAPVGGKWAVAHLWRGITITGFFGWILREIVDFRYFLTILPFKKALAFFFFEIKIFTRND